MNFLKYIWKRNFSRAELITEADGHRTASTLELFMDLAFVGVLASLAHFLVGAKEVNSDVILGFLLRFTSAFALWWNLIWYNNLFENKTLRHRLLMVVIVITIIGQQVAYDLDSEKGYYFLLSFYALSRLVEVFLWGSATLPKKQPSHALRVSSLFYIFGILGAVVLVALTPVITGELKPNYLIWTISVLLEFVAPTLLFTYNMKRLVKKGEAPLPPMNHELFKERFGLLFLLILGEGIVSAIKVFGLFESFGITHAVVFGSMIVFIAYGLWEAYFDIVHAKHNQYKDAYVNHWSTINFFMFLGAMLILGTIPELVHPHHPNNIGILSTLQLIGIGMFNIGLYFIVLIRDENAKYLEESYHNVGGNLNRKAIRFTLTSYSIVGLVAIVLGLTGVLQGEAAMYYTCFASAMFIVLKQYVAYATLKQNGML